jgi:hypothetical protein
LFSVKEQPAVSARIKVLCVLLAGVALLTAGCTSGKNDQSSATTAQAGAPAAGPLTVKVSTTARGPEQGFNAGKAAKQVSPDIQKFVSRYLTVAFMEPAQAQSGYKDLLAMFDTPVRANAKKQLDSLSLGSVGSQVKAVRPGKATAKAVVLFGGGHPIAATVNISFDGTADTEQGSGPLRLRSVFQLLRAQSGWRIAAYDSNTGGQN